MPLETPKYNSSEVRKKFEDAGYDWETIKERLAEVATREEVDRKLQELVGNSEGYFDYLKGLIDQELESPSASIDFSNLTPEALKEQAERGVTGAKRYLAEKQAELINVGEEKFRSSVKESFLGKLLPEKLVNWIIDTGKQKVQGKLEGIGGAIKGWIVSFLVGIIPGGKLLMDGYKKYFGGNDKEDGETPPDNAEVNGGEAGQVTTPEVAGEGGNEGDVERWGNTKKDVYESAGYKIIALQSGIKSEENENATGVYAELGGRSIENIKKVFFETNQEEPGALKKAFGIQGNIEGSEVQKILLGIIGPFNTSFLVSSFSDLASVQGLLQDGNGKLLPGVQEVFSSEEIKLMHEVQFDYTKLPLSMVSRLISLYWKNKGMHTIGYLSETTQQVGASVQGFVFGGELVKTIQTLGETAQESKIFPERVAGLFKDIPSGKGYMGETGAELRETFGKEVEYSETEIKLIDDFIAYRNQIQQYIPQLFSFGMPGFSKAFEAKLDYANLASIYILTQGKAITELETQEKLIMYGWIISILGEDQLRYVTAILNTLKENGDTLTEDEANILLILSYRILEGQRNGVIKTVQNIGGAIHDGIKYQLPENLDEGTKDWIGYAIESSSAVGIWTLLGKITPIGRTVMVISAGVGIGALYYFSGEAGYQALDTTRRQKLDDFLKQSFPEKGEPEEIRKKIQSGDIDLLSLYGKGEDMIFKLFAS